MNFRTAIKQIFKSIIPTAFQAGAENFSNAGFESDTLLIILAKLKRGYKHLQVKEITGAMKRLLDPFDRNQTIEELIWEVEDV